MLDSVGQYEMCTSTHTNSLTTASKIRPFTESCCTKLGHSKYFYVSVLKFTPIGWKMNKIKPSRHSRRNFALVSFCTECQTHQGTNMDIRSRNWFRPSQANIIGPILMKPTLLRRLLIRNFIQMPQKCSAAAIRSPEGRRRPSSHKNVIF